MSLEELLRQMEEFRARKELRDSRPDWLRQFVKEAADLFEPLDSYGRVGFDCQGHERGWTVRLYLGATEIIGGPRDGEIEHAGFVIDLKSIDQLFSSVQRLEWFSVQNSEADRFHEPVRSVISVHGLVEDGHAVHLELLHAPPTVVAPGMRRTDDELDLH